MNLWSVYNLKILPPVTWCNVQRKRWYTHSKLTDLIEKKCKIHYCLLSIIIARNIYNLCNKIVHTSCNYWPLLLMSNTINKKNIYTYIYYIILWVYLFNARSCLNIKIILDKRYNFIGIMWIHTLNKNHV